MTLSIDNVSVCRVESSDTLEFVIESLSYAYRYFVFDIIKEFVCSTYTLIWVSCELNHTTHGFEASEDDFNFFSIPIAKIVDIGFLLTG